MSAERIAELIREAKSCVALTGAGVSTESGIPDFRSPTGVWATVDPREFASLSAFRRDPEKVWSFYRLRINMLTQAQPNRAHRALAALERGGWLEALVTQNIDLLHERAGSRQVIEVHGSIRSCSCGRCRERYALARVLELLAATDGAPRCPECASILKPDVVFFEEQLPVDAIDRAYALARETGLLLVVGSSLEVYPVAELPSVTKAAGGRVAIVNLGPTQFDGLADLVVDGPAGEVLEQVVSLLEPQARRI
jgi:NAD-dependent deacetylase